ncbi:hypothetical protein [Actinoplanes rectilineatus]|uniref:hypothetical protein n=1 Tax=Actinoplanes rectilineatus TaxID=113571 RepID=UPI0005F2A781|nr:hypothetical protein [Actinoplanes rectilineatus]
MAYSEDLITIVDQRISLAGQTTRATGTVVDVDTSGPGATVLFDGAATAMPVKILGSVFARQGHRVTLDKYGKDWVVTGAFAGPGFGEASRVVEGLSGTTAGMTSATFVDLTEFGSFSFSKMYDGTYVRLSATFMAMSSGTFTRAGWAVRLTPTAGGAGYTPTDVPVGFIYFSQASVYGAGSGARRLINVPAGTYTATLRWRRISGTGSITADHNAWFQVEIDEGVRANQPVL